MKTVGIVVGVLLIVVVGAVVYIAQNVNSLVENAIEDLGSKALGTTVRVASVDISLTEGRGTIKGLEIANPKGYDGPYLMQLDEITVDLDLDELSAETIVLERVLIDGARIAAIVKGKDDSNLQTLMDNLDTGSSAAAETDAGEITVIIDRLDFVNAQATVDAVFLSEQVAIDVPDVHLSGIGRKEGGATAGEVAAALLKPITEAVVREMITRSLGGEDLEANIKNKIFDKLKGFGRSED
ncbi:MAG: hypothetical protein E2O58_13190 [Gammaproteobacteria bacterium]|nr:MAG: hypothetical protein E2O58_13190 [Gammaproteobacteria bacterium]